MRPITKTNRESSDAGAKMAVITNIKGPVSFKSFLMSHGIVVGTVFTFNYSPVYAGLVNISIDNRMLSIRKNEFYQIEWEWKK